CEVILELIKVCLNILGCVFVTPVITNEVKMAVSSAQTGQVAILSAWDVVYMDNTRVLMLFILSLTITAIMCQRFQYSDGWTNGKRSTPSVLEEVVNSASKNADQSDNILVDCELQKLKLLLQGKINNALSQLPCELLSSTKKESFPENMINHFRRQPTLANNND
ncbi:unnamed protein product, partial [Heterotrigona itama]